MLGRLLDILVPTLLVAGVVLYLGLVAAGLIADWHLPYPLSFFWLAGTGLPALGLALMYWRAGSPAIAREGEEE